ncbi:MAG: DNA (cytosine-5-)-methyltransferase [Devosiaceae bacterium]|nr:DNA (cytosine-5-)-methyltransferase [Devosiaceae bacterium]
MSNKNSFSIAHVADILSVSKTNIMQWERNKKLIPSINPLTGEKEYSSAQLIKFDQAKAMFNSKWDEEIKIAPAKKYNCIELFAGAGGLALGLEKAGLSTIMLNEIDRHACATLKKNKPEWNVIEGDIADIDFSKYHKEIDILSGGFPCQAFSYAGNKLGLEDTRGTLFFEFARALKQCAPKIFVAENVKGLSSHDKGRTLKTIKKVFTDLGYSLVEPKILKAIFYQVPQKRERLFIIGIRSDLSHLTNFAWPSPYRRIMTLKDALKKGELYDCDVPKSEGQKYPKRKAQILKQVPQGGYWRDLSDKLQREYMQKSYFLDGGKTGMARRLSWDEPSLTLTCSPAQKQTERCHPQETRPLSVREYARVQTFPDDWEFSGSVGQQYKQIGNAVPVNLAYAVGRSLVKLLNDIQQKEELGIRTKY